MTSTEQLTPPREFSKSFFLTGALTKSHRIDECVYQQLVIKVRYARRVEDRAMYVEGTCDALVAYYLARMPARWKYPKRI